MRETKKGKRARDLIELRRANQAARRAAETFLEVASADAAPLVLATEAHRLARAATRLTSAAFWVLDGRVPS